MRRAREPCSLFVGCFLNLAASKRAQVAAAGTAPCSLSLSLPSNEAAAPVACSAASQEFLIDASEYDAIFADLVTLLFGYAYDHRTTCGESTVESAWTSCKVSASLSWLEHFSGSEVSDVSFTTLQTLPSFFPGPLSAPTHPPTADPHTPVVSFQGLREAVVAGLRRSLIYPYLRNWDLSNRILQDVCTIFRRGRRCILRCLLQLHSVLAHSEHYLFNKLFVTDYCIW